MKITNYNNQEVEIQCLGCAREEGVIPRLGTIITSKFFDAHQDFEIPIPGFIIISSRRHIQSVDEFSDEEKIDFINLIARIRQVLRNVLKISVVYLHQEEDTSHHFHLWMFPRQDQLIEKFGKKVESMRPVMEYARANLKTPENMVQIENTVELLKQNLG